MSLKISQLKVIQDSETNDIKQTERRLAPIIAYTVYRNTKVVKTLNSLNHALTLRELIQGHIFLDH